MSEIDTVTIDSLERLLDVCWSSVAKIEWRYGDIEPLAARLLFVTLQHCLAAIYLLRMDLDASAATLIRSCAETGSRSLYLLLCATPEEVEMFKGDLPKAFGRHFEETVEHIRSHLRARPHLPFSEAHIDGLFKFTVDNYSVFSSYSHGGWQPVTWTHSGPSGILNSRFPAAIRCLSAMVLAETAAQAVMVHLVLQGLRDEAESVVKAQREVASPAMQERMILDFNRWAAEQQGG